jgi:ABC-type multidrug transport system fused ATPase/permease subunit
MANNLTNFKRSLNYLRPYKGRLITSFLLVLGIAVLWGGGLGLALPGSKILLSAEGLHGWAWNTMTADRLDATVSVRITPAGTNVQGRPVSLVLAIEDLNKDGLGAQAGLSPGEWIVGLQQDNQPQFLRGDVLARRLATWDAADRRARLLTWNPATDQLQTRPIELGKLTFNAQMLGEVATRIPEPKTREGRYPIFVWLLVIALVATVLRNIFRFVQEYLVETAVLKGIWDLRRECYNTALRQPITYFAQSGTSDTMSRFMQDTGELARAQTTLFGKTLVEPAKCIASVIGALLLDWKLTLVAMIGGPICYWIIRTFGKAIKRSTKRALENWADMLAVLEETLQGIRVVKAYTMESAERKRFYRVNRQLYKQQRRIARVDAAVSPTIEVLGIVAALLAAGWAGKKVFYGEMDPDVFLSWMVLLAAMFDPVRKLSKVITRFQRGDAAAARIFELKDREPETRTPGAPRLPRLSEGFRFTDVAFRYPNVNDETLREINLEVPAGNSVAIVGPNGSGKTTLVSLIPRLIEPTAGRIELDGRDIMTHSLRSLRQQIALVTQETVIFNATIAENIAYGQRRASQEEILAAAKKAFVDEFVNDMPDGFETMVGQRGATLSGGQRQRIAIARAILRDPAILIFDEAMSQVDADSERRIHQAMEEFMKGRTTFMIAHRFWTVASADTIVVMDEGRIVDAGPHAELLERCELYAHLHRTQFVETP